jgi:hypothetical protein
LTDPFYNKNFSLERGPFTDLRPPEEAAARDWTVLASSLPPTLVFPKPDPLPEPVEEKAKPAKTSAPGRPKTTPSRKASAAAE